MKIINESISLEKKLAEESFGDFVKAVVDIEIEIMSIGGELHADEEYLLLNEGSRQENLWGINIYPFNDIDKRIEFDSMINVRPRQNNRTRGVENPDLQSKIIEITNKLITN